ncbi:MAG: hypothetical protein Q4G69_09135 [Planctomycetia bacterium]|nr:hypothetical protein [Planctomycetia bacterium]
MLKKMRFFLPLFFLLFAGTLWGAGKRDTLEGLVYEVEEWSEPKDAWNADKGTSDKWNLWSKEENVINKRSNGKSLITPVVKKDRDTPEEGAPVLHTKITDIPNGRYHVYMNGTNRRMAMSFDAGKTWQETAYNREGDLGIFDIKDGKFEIWVDDRYATPDRIGSSYYDYIRFVPTEDQITLYQPAVFTLPSGDTQISWITSTITGPGKVVVSSRYASSDKENVFTEAESGLRNHRVVLTGLKNGKKYSASIEIPINAKGEKTAISIAFIAGERPKWNSTKKDKIVLKVNEPTKYGRVNWPITSGIPFAQGTLASAADVCLRDPAGKAVPLQAESYVCWPDGSIKWLLCDFLANTEPGKAVEYTLETGKGIGEKYSQKDSEELKNRARDIAVRSASVIELEDGTRLESQPGSEMVESQGPVQVSLKLEGDYQNPNGDPSFHWRAHVSAFKSGFVRLRWTLGNHDLKNPYLRVRSADLGWKQKDQAVGFGASPASSASLSDGTSAKKDLLVLQDLVDRLTMKADGKSITPKEKAFDGLIAAGNQILWVRDFWKTWPKGIRFEKGSCRVLLLPELAKKDYLPKNGDTIQEAFMHFYWYKDGSYQFKQGMEIQTEIWFADLPDQGKEKSVYAEWFAHPLFAAASPDYYCNTKAFGEVNPQKAGSFDDYEKAFEKSFVQLEEGRKKRSEYGWMNFGDWFGERSWNWGNNEYDLPYACLLQFVRTGNADYLFRGFEMARHYTTIDFIAAAAPNKRELMYAHSTGHVGGFIDKEDPRLPALGKVVANLKGSTDGSGGHAFLTGAFYMGCLSGEKRLFDVAAEDCWNQAERYTPAFKIHIERAVGWPIINAVNAWKFTGNPYYLNAARIFFEAVKNTQNPETGCFDLKQDQSECDCPDKKEHRGGKAFATGVLLHGLARLYEADHDPDVKTSIVRCSDWLLDYAWNEEKGGFRYKTGCPKYENMGRYSILVIEGILYAGEITDNPRYLKFIERTLGPHLKKTSGSGSGSGKSFTQMFRQTPHALFYLQKHGINNL